MKLNTPTLAMIGMPLINIKTVISASTDNVERAITKNMRSDNFPLNFFISPRLPMRG
jgi:hypothetical protein